MNEHINRQNRNLLPFIVKELGLEIGDMFTVLHSCCVFKFSDEWAYYKIPNDDGSLEDIEWTPCPDDFLIELIKGGEIITEVFGKDCEEGKASLILSS